MEYYPLLENILIRGELKMLGVVFTEFLDMVDDKFGADMVDDIIDDAKLESDGAYTSVGTYDHNDMVSLVAALSKRSSISVDDLVITFGTHLFTRFVDRFPVFFTEVEEPFKFLESIDGYIHKEVRKLYPDAELPEFSSDRVDDKTMTLTYKSVRRFSNLAHGLIRGTMSHFDQPAEIVIDDKSTDSGSHVVFTITKL
jgi:hypothetical protein